MLPYWNHRDTGYIYHLDNSLGSVTTPENPTIIETHLFAKNKKPLVHFWDLSVIVPSFWSMMTGWDSETPLWGPTSVISLNHPYDVPLRQMRCTLKRGIGLMLLEVKIWEIKLKAHIQLWRRLPPGDWCSVLLYVNPSCTVSLYKNIFLTKAKNYSWHHIFLAFIIKFNFSAKWNEDLHGWCL